MWGLNNLGFGNRGLIRERQAEQEQTVIELFRTQDNVAAEIADVYAQLQAAARRVVEAEAGVRQAQLSFAGNLRGMSQTTRFGDVLVLVNRPQEVVAALQQLATSYDNYFISVNDYNRANSGCITRWAIRPEFSPGSDPPARFSPSTPAGRFRCRPFADEPKSCSPGPASGARLARCAGARLTCGEGRAVQDQARPRPGLRPVAGPQSRSTRQGSQRLQGKHRSSKRGKDCGDHLLVLPGAVARGNRRKARKCASRQ